MKKFIYSVFIVSVISCNGLRTEHQQYEARIDSLQTLIDHAYKPGLGEFMLSMQTHHAKLWFAGEAQNWQLADFEAKEIEETLEDIQTYCKDRSEVKSIAIINPAIDSIKAAIAQKDLQRFTVGFSLLTNSCNNCHAVTEHPFNVIKIPTTPPVSNQEFNTQATKH